MLNPKKLNRFFTVCVAISLGLTAGFVSYTQVLQAPDQALTNWYYDHTITKSLDSRITVIAIDEASELAYGSYETWSRSLLSDAISELSEQNAGVIGLDIDLSKPSSDKTGDTDLAKACENAGNVIAVASVHYAPETLYDSEVPQTSETSWSSETPIQPVTDISYPYQELLAEVTIGIGNATQKSLDGFVRSAALSINYEDTKYDSFAVAVYKAFQDYLGLEYTLPELDSDEMFGFNALNGEINCNVISFCDLLSGNYDSVLIEDNIVLIGKYNENPFSTLEQIVKPMQEQQEVLMQASIIQSLLNQKTIKDVHPLLQAICYTILITVCYLIIASPKIWGTLLSCFLLSQAVVGIGFGANALGYRFQLLVPMLFFLLAFIIALIQRYIVSLIERKRMERTLKMYVEPQVVDQLAEKMPFELCNMSERKNIAILFVDIRGFTTISESLEPEQVVEILNEYLTLIATVVQQWDGTLDKFIGDAAMVFFNAPNEQEDYIYRAVCSAYEICKHADYLREKYEKLYGKPVTFGIGVNCGEAIVGNIGSMNRMDYTAIGDTVNTASRLESNAKAGQILISESVYHAVSNRINASYVGSLTLKGKSKTVETYQVDSIPELDKTTSRRKGKIHEALILHSKLRSHN